MAVSRSGQSEATQKIREALGVRLFTPPPENFDPLQASDDELREYGCPTRPDIDLYPELHERWEQMMSRPMLFIEPQFAVTSNWRLSPRQDLVAPTGQNWSGSIAYPPDGDKVTFVSGRWTVPAIVAPKSYFGWYSCTTWIGIDGGPQGGFGGPNYFVQAGTVQEGDLFGTKTYPWFEWPPNGPTPIHNLQVRPGDVVFCEINIHSRTEVSVFMWNLTTRVATPYAIEIAPPDEYVVGKSAEWILETPAYNSTPGVLAQYGEVYFDQCIATTRDHAILLGGQGELLSQSDVNGQIISTPNVLTDQLIKIRYTASP